MRAILATAALALFGAIVSAAELPLSGVYGTPRVCAALRTGQDIAALVQSESDPAIMVDQTHIDGLEWACDFREIKPNARGGYSVHALCQTETSEAEQQLEILPNSASKSLTITGASGQPLTLFLCKG